MKTHEILLRPVDMEDKVSMATIYTYCERINIDISVFPIPEWLQGATCECKSPAKFLKNDTPICQKCLSRCLENANYMKQEKDISVPLSIDVLRRLRYEWSPNNEKWYSIRGKNIQLSGLEKTFVEKMKPVLLGEKESEAFEGEYDKDTKILSIDV